MRGVRRALEGRPQRALGQFFTPRAVADFAAQTLASLGAFDVERPRVIDPAAGPAIFLDAVKRVAPTVRTVGLDLDAAFRAAGVRVANGLLDQKPLGVRNGAFDVAVGNPPYGGLGLVELQRLARGDGGADDWRLAEAVLGGSKLWRIAEGPPPPELAERRLTPRLRRVLERAFRFPIENFFAERFVRLLRPGGWLAVVVPEGLLANARAAFVRDWMATQGQVAAVIGLPRVFSAAGASARTSVLFFQRKSAAAETVGERTVQIAGPNMEWRPRGAAAATVPDLAHYLTSAPRVAVSWHELRRARWDPAWWDPRWADPLAGMAIPTRPLGDFIGFMTYGPIVTGRSPADDAGDVPVISQGQIEESGVNLGGAARVAANGIFDPPRSRVLPRDLLLPRSGAGSLGRNRLAVYEGEETANVGCFVNVIRLTGINPYFVWLFLKTRFGWGQLRRIINGVGMPNISFDEIRALRIPCVDERLAQAVEEAYRNQVRPAHVAWVANHGGRDDAESRFAALVAGVERALAEGSALESAYS